ncbi:hypothetical protein HK102_005313 [Quaeritorhiza haematococci]|nr:hypothetical protein HK102_005313 [Quaeritorhiza haematococci]
MTTKDELIAWADGIDAYQQGDFYNALELFKQVGDYSRISFNIGMIYSRLEDHGTGVLMFTRATRQDPYLAVAYFQRAYSHFMLDEYTLAEEDYSLALELLLENDAIDYTQVGLKYRLYRCEVLFNRAMCRHQLGDTNGAVQDITDARKVIRTEEQRSVIERAARMGAEQLTLFTVPDDALYQVAEAKLKNLNRKQHLKEAKVVVSRDAEDDFTGFSGAQILERANSRKDDSDVLRPTTTLRRLAQQAEEQDFVGSPSPSRTGSRYPTPPPLDTSNPGATRSPTHFRQRSSSLSTPRTGTIRSANSLEREPTSASRRRPSQPERFDEALPRPDFGEEFTLAPRSTTSSGSSTMSRSETLRNKVKIKVHLKDITVVVYLSRDATAEELTQRVQEKLKLPGRPLVAFRDLEDPENHLISITDDDDLELAFEQLNLSPGGLQMWVQQVANGNGAEIYDLY